MELHYFLPLRPTFVLLALSRAAFSFPSFAKYASNASTEISTTPANGEISPDVATAVASSANAGKHANIVALKANAADALASTSARRDDARVVTAHPREHRPRIGARTRTRIALIIDVVAIIIHARVSAVLARGRPPWCTFRWAAKSVPGAPEGLATGYESKTLSTSTEKPRASRPMCFRASRFARDSTRATARCATHFDARNTHDSPCISAVVFIAEHTLRKRLTLHSHERLAKIQ